VIGRAVAVFVARALLLLFGIDFVVWSLTRGGGMALNIAGSALVALSVALSPLSSYLAAEVRRGRD